MVVVDGLALLGVHHETDDLIDLLGHEVVFGEDIEPELLEVAIEAVVDLPHLAFEDPLHGKGQCPVVVFVGAHGIVHVETVGVAALLDLQQVLVDFFDRSPRHLVDERVRHILVFGDGTGHLDAEPLCRILQVWSVGVHQMGIAVAEQRSQRAHRVPFKEAGVEFRVHGMPE